MSEVIRLCSMGAFAAMALLLATVAYGDLRYQPRNPSFGGNPHYGGQQMQRAQAQNATSSPGLASGWKPRSQQERFEERLQSTIIREITRGVRQGIGILDEEGNLRELDGPIQAGDFAVDIQRGEHGSLTIITEDTVTGEQSEFTIEAGIE